MKSRRSNLAMSFVVPAAIALAGTTGLGAETGHSFDYQKVADSARWGFSDEADNPLFCMFQQAGTDYGVQLVREAQDPFALTISIVSDNAPVYQWKGHKHSVFRIQGDHLYYAHFSFSSTGGHIVAVHLTSGNELWRSRLKALGEIRHSTYLNRMTIEADDEVVSIYGNETMGRYLEFKPIKTGKTVGHRLFPREETAAPPGLPGIDRFPVPVNTQKTLIEAVGKQFKDEDWEYPSDLLPNTFPGLKHVSGPGDSGVSGKGDWRKPVTLKHGPTGTEVFVNCYRRRKQPAQSPDPSLPGTPFLPLEEPDYRYESAEFHDLKAAAAREKTRDVFAFLDGDVLFKVEASGGSSEQRLKLVRSTAEAIWVFRHREDAATIRGFFRPTNKAFFADEPITIEMVVHNDGPEDFRFDKGGDYRFGNGRHDRFFVAFEGSDGRYASAGGGLLGVGTVPAKGVYRQVIDLTPWGPPGPDDQGIIRVTCRRTLSTQVTTKLLVDCLERQPIDYTTKDARAVLIAQMTRLNQRRAGFVDDREKQKEVERVVDLYLRFPQIRSAFECKVKTRVRREHETQNEKSAVSQGGD